MNHSAAAAGRRTKRRGNSGNIMELMQKITTAVDQKQHGVHVFVDLKKTSNTTDHSILIEKLNMDIYLIKIWIM